MITNHWGIYVDSETPTTGVIGVNELNMEFIIDDMYYHGGIDLSYEGALDELAKSFVGKSIDEIDRIREDFDEHWESSPDDEWLIGDWIKDEDGFYIHDPNGEFAAIVRSDVVQVVFSKTIKRVRSLCSPCYPGQADLCLDGMIDTNQPDSGYLCFSLPDDYFYRPEA